MENNKEHSIYTYKREHGELPKNGERKRKNGIGKNVVRRFFLILASGGGVGGLVAMLAGFFLARAVLLGELYPFGSAFVAGMCWCTRTRCIFAVAGVLGGLCSVLQGHLLVSQILCVFLAGFGVRFVPSGTGRPWLVVPGLVLAVVMVVRACFLAFEGALPYDYISVSFEAFFASLFTLLVMHALPALSVLRSPGVLKGEEMVCIMALAGGVIAGTGEISRGLFSLKSILSYFLILLGALVGGTGPGAATGAVVGVIPGLAYTVFPDVVGAYSFNGLLAGLFRPFGKPGVIIGFLLGSIILSLYMSSYEGITAVVAQSAVAALPLLFVPGGWIEELKSSLVPGGGTGGEKGASGEKIKEIVSDRVNQWSRVFKEIARSFEEAAPSAFRAGEDQNWQALLSEVGKKVCKGCSHFSGCWEREFYRTYQTLLALFAVAENYGRVTPDDIDEEMASKCSRTKELAITVTCLHEMFKLNRFWSRRMAESGDLVTEQLKGMGEILENLSGELEANERSSGWDSRLLKQKLKKTGVRVSSLEIYEARGEAPEVNVTMPACGERMICRYEVGPFLSREMGCSMSVATVNCPHGGRNEFCSFRLYSSPRYQLSLGMAAVGKDGSDVSGDSYLFLPLTGGKFAILLSDGMGSGHRAAAESSATLGLMVKLLEAGFNRDLAIKTVNSVLMLRSCEESFATVDMTVVDIYGGGAEFSKIGACPGFIVRGQQVGTVRANSLPVGIVDEVEVFTISKQLGHGDLIIMVTDGVLACDGTDNKEDWLAGVLAEISGLKPQEVAELIINLAKTGSRSDDMTAVVVRVEKVKN